IYAGIAAPDFNVDFFATFDPSFLGRNQCVDTFAGAQAFPQAIFFNQQFAFGFLPVGPALWGDDLDGVNRAISYPFGKIPFANVSSGSIADVLRSIAFTNAGFHTGVSSAQADVNTTLGDPYPAAN